MSSYYLERIRNRSFLNFLKGAIVRFPPFIKYLQATSIARKKGALVGKNVTMSKDFARKLNQNISIGDNVSILSCEISSVRYKLSIGSNSIIGSDTKIIMGGHNIDSSNWEHQRKSEGLIIEEYVWICPHSIILPSVKFIGRGAVIGAGSVVVKDVGAMEVVSGNPAKVIRKRLTLHTDLCVESLLGGDFLTYIKTWLKK